jgi:hypothetical protein
VKGVGHSGLITYFTLRISAFPKVRRSAAQHSPSLGKEWNEFLKTIGLMSLLTCLGAESFRLMIYRFL